MDNNEQSNKPVGMNDIKDTIWESVTYLKKARNQIGWSIAELSKRSGVSVGVISDLENDKGKVPSLANFIALTRTLNMSKEFVLGTILEYKLCDEQAQEDLKLGLINNIRDYGIHDEESINFILHTMDFVRTRKKNTTI